MKRSQAIKAIFKILKTWQDSKLEERTANQILTKLEKLGMSPPWYVPPKQKYTDPEDEFGEWSSLNEIQDWEPEGDKTDFDLLIEELQAKRATKKASKSIK